MTLRETKQNQDFFDSLEMNVLESYEATPTVSQHERAFNELDKQPDQHDAKSVQTLVEEFFEDPICNVTIKNLKKSGKFTVQKVTDWSYAASIPLKDLLSALAVQRPIDKKHLKKIQEKYNPHKVQFVNVLKIKFKGKYFLYIIDGQHTATTIGIRARLGLIEGYNSDNWQNVPINCQVVECDNFTFAREHFLGINGDDKLELARFDKWKNMVLGKRQDSPNEDCGNPEWEDAYEQQCILEKYGIYPVHESNKTELVKPGAFPRVDLLKDMKPEDLHWICQVHQLNWDHLPVDAFEVLPMRKLKERMRCDTSLDNIEVKDFVIQLANVIKNTVGTPSKWKKLTEKTYKLYIKTINGEDTPKKISVDEDASLALLLQCYYRAGGKFSKIRKMFLNDFKEGEYELFDALTLDGENVDENLKNIIEH